MKKILFIDTLTTGMDHQRCEIYRIGGIFCEETAAELKEKKRFELYVRPTDSARISENSLWVGGATKSRLIYFPEQNKAFEDFFRLIQERVNLRSAKDKLYISGFNAAAMDVPFIAEWFKRNGNQRFRDCFLMQTLDLMCLSAFALTEERNGMPDFHLETAAKQLNVTPVKREKYSCLDNAETCLKMYIKLNAILGKRTTRHTLTNDIYTNHTEKDKKLW